MNKKIILLVILLVFFGAYYCYTYNDSKPIANIPTSPQVNISDNDGDLETQLWNLYHPTNSKSKREFFHIEKVNDNETIALGSSSNYKGGGANIFAFRLTPENQWEVHVTQEALQCAHIEDATPEQIIFIKENATNTCVIWNSGQMTSKKL